LEQEIVILYAAVNGYVDHVPLEQIRAYEQQLYDHMGRQHPDLLATLRESADLSRDTEEQLQRALVGFREVFVGPGRRAETARPRASWPSWSSVRPSRTFRP
jgi:F-type H+-transporting ATPase subunit alpha